MLSKMKPSLNEWINLPYWHINPIHFTRGRTTLQFRLPEPDDVVEMSPVNWVAGEGFEQNPEGPGFHSNPIFFLGGRRRSALNIHSMITVKLPKKCYLCSPHLHCQKSALIKSPAEEWLDAPFHNHLGYTDSLLGFFERQSESVRSITASVNLIVSHCFVLHVPGIEWTSPI